MRVLALSLAAVTKAMAFPSHQFRERGHVSEWQRSRLLCVFYTRI